MYANARDESAPPRDGIRKYTKSGGRTRGRRGIKKERDEQEKEEEEKEEDEEKEEEKEKEEEEAACAERT